METVTDFIFLGSKITGKKCLLLRRKAMTNLDSVLKRKNIILLTKVCLVKAMVFPVVMYGCERWTIKKAECRRNDVFKLWCWRKLWELVMDREAWHCSSWSHKESDMTELLN